MQKEQWLKHIFLFENAASDTLMFAAQSPLCRIANFEKGQTVFDDPHLSPALVCVVEGSLLVENNGVVIRTLESGDVFGVASLYQQQTQYVSTVRARKHTSLLFLPQELMTRLMRMDFAVAESYIAFLSGRIYYLNSLLDRYTASSAEQSVAQYLLSAYYEAGQNEFAVNMSALAKGLNIGRASVYRAVQQLEKSGILQKEQKTIRILDPSGLKDKSGKRDE